MNTFLACGMGGAPATPPVGNTLVILISLKCHYRRLLSPFYLLLELHFACSNDVRAALIILLPAE